MDLTMMMQRFAQGTSNGPQPGQNLSAGPPADVAQGMQRRSDSGPTPADTPDTPSTGDMYQNALRSAMYKGFGTHGGAAGLPPPPAAPPTYAQAVQGAMYPGYGTHGGMPYTQSAPSNDYTAALQSAMYRRPMMRSAI
jgi:hypothetical protein